MKSGYAFNRALGGKGRKDIRHPERTVLLYESDLGWNGADGPRSLCRPPRHRRGNLIAFADGGVDVVPPMDEPKLNWRP